MNYKNPAVAVWSNCACEVQVGRLRMASLLPTSN